MKKILIIGGGRQGSLVAKDFLEDRCEVTIADIKNPHIKGTTFVKLDAGGYKILNRPKENSYFFRPFDLVVNTLPGDISFPVTKSIAYAGVKCVDLSFTHEDIFELDDIAREYGSIIVPDCGLAPGLPNLLVGEQLRKQAVEEIKIYVGGVALNRDAPYGYVCSWSPVDLKTEYLRPAQIIVDGKIVTRNPLAKPETIFLQGDGTMEAFYSDGLRTLLKLKDRVPNISELTLRWPGHIKSIKELLNSDKDFVEEIVANCSSGADEVFLLVSIKGEYETIVYKMIAHAYREQSAMSRTTAHTCYAIGKILLQGLFTDKGIHPPEHLSFHSSDCLKFVESVLEKKGMRILEVSTIQ